jgi:DNA gyrase subunit A
MERPDLTQTPQSVIEYIEYLEEIVRQTKSSKATATSEEIAADATPITQEPPTSIQILTASSFGYAKRTARHHYIPQHRGGTGNADMLIENDDKHAFLSSLDDATTMIAFSNFGRVFRIPVSRFEAKGLREPGDWLWDRIERTNPSEKITAVLPVQATGFVAMVTRTGRIRALRHHLFGDHMRHGMSVFSPMEHGELISACWTKGAADILIATRNGMAIRFSEKIISSAGDQSIKLMGQDEVIGIAPINSDSEVFVATGDGKGTLRKMTGFAPNKSAGGSGKILIKSNSVVGIVAVNPDDHIFLLTLQGKIIRFPVNEVPPTDAPVQGVNCMTLRNDFVISVIKSGQLLG